MKKILVFAPHADDEMIGVGGTIIKNIYNGNRVYVCVVTKGCYPVFNEDYVNTLRCETIECHKKVGIEETFFLDFPSVFLEEEHRYTINSKILEVVEKISPDEVFIPHFGDMQKDHQIVSEACMVALRPKYKFAPKRILSYEVLSETGWNIPNVQNDFIPNVYEDISPFLKQKIEAVGIYKSQISEFPATRSIEAIEALAKYRGAQMNMLAAESFSLIREIK